MRSVGWAGATIAALALLLKLFTYEFVLRDDPTIGVALRTWPSLVSRQVLSRSPSAIVVQSENDFLGSGLYESFAWLELPLYFSPAPALGAVEAVPI
jgi:hypothetical protein